jgi:hypothetical protein
MGPHHFAEFVAGKPGLLLLSCCFGWAKVSHFVVLSTSFCSGHPPGRRMAGPSRVRGSCMRKQLHRAQTEKGVNDPNSPAGRACVAHT